MKTTLDLLKRIIDLGFDQKKTLTHIDKMLDKKLGIGSRKPLSDEELTDEIYEGILNVYKGKTDINEALV